MIVLIEEFAEANELADDTSLGLECDPLEEWQLDACCDSCVDEVVAGKAGSWLPDDPSRLFQKENWSYKNAGGIPAPVQCEEVFPTQPSNVVKKVCCCRCPLAGQKCVAEFKREPVGNRLLDCQCGKWADGNGGCGAEFQEGGLPEGVGCNHRECDEEQ